MEPARATSKTSGRSWVCKQLMPTTVNWLYYETMVVHMACGLAHSLVVTSECHVFRFSIMYDEITRKLEKVAPVPEYHYDNELAELFS